MTDQQLLRDYAGRRSETAFAELVRRHVDPVYSAAMRMVRDAHLAEDVTQAVFVALAQNARQLTDRAVLSGWLHRTTQNLAANAVRSDVRRRAREQQAAAMNLLLSPESESPHPGATEADAWDRIAPHLDAALEELNEPDRDALLLRYFDRQSAREMAQTLGISDEAAQKRVTRAVDRLRDLFAKRGVTVGAGGLAVGISANAVQAAPAGLALTIFTAATLAGTTIATTATAATKAIAMTTLQKTIFGAAIAAVIGTGVYEAHRASRQQDQLDQLERQRAELAAQVEQLRHERDDAAGRIAALSTAPVPRLPAPQFQPPAAVAEDLQATNLYERLKNKPGTLTHDQVASYLKANGRNAASLLAAYRTTGDPSLLTEAMEKYPTDPQVAFEASFRTNSTPEERRQWIEAFKSSAPDNALANYLSALDYFRSGQTDRAIQEMLAAAGKPLQDYTSERYQDDAEAYLAAGYSVADAKGTAGYQLLLPQLKEMKQLGLNLIELSKSYRQGGDDASAQAALQMAINLGQQYSTPFPGEPEISRLVGIALEQIALHTLDPTSPYGNSGQTVQDRLNQLTAQRSGIEQLAPRVEEILSMMSDEDWINYRDRWLMFGEQNAVSWLLNKYGRNSTSSAGAAGQ